MTNEEAIKEIQKWIDGCPFENTKEAFNLAIKALEDIEEWNKLRPICASEGIFVYKVKED